MAASVAWNRDPQFCRPSVLGTTVAVSVARFLCPDSRAATTASHLPDNTNKNVGSIMASHGPGLLAHDQTPELNRACHVNTSALPCVLFVRSSFAVRSKFNGFLQLCPGYMACFKAPGTDTEGLPVLRGAKPSPAAVPWCLNLTRWCPLGS